MRRLLALIALLGMSQVARADDNVECYTSTGTWNAPAGALVLNRSSGSGPVSSLISSLGEYYTHSATSHGYDAWGTQWGSMNTMRMPRSYPSGSSTCGAPVEPNDLANGWPGARSEDAGGLWAYYYSNGGFMNGQTTMIYSMALPNTYSFNSSSTNPNGTAGLRYGSDATVASCLIAWEKNKLAGTQGCGSNSPGAGCGGANTGPASDSPNWNYGFGVYSFSQFQNSPSGYGTMCAGLISSAFWASKNGSGGWCAPGSILPYTYPNSKVVNAAGTLYNNVTSGSQGFWGTLGACISCLDCNLLDEAGDQVVDCFANNQGTHCGQSNHDWAWNGVYGHTATSISPDRLWGISGHDWSTNNNSPWRPASYGILYFNQGGNQYGCWY
jgi:hypothetical protein